MEWISYGRPKRKVVVGREEYVKTMIGAILFYLYRYFWKLDFIEPERKPRIFWATYSVKEILILYIFPCDRN